MPAPTRPQPQRPARATAGVAGVVLTALAAAACDAASAALRPLHGAAFEPAAPAPALRLPTARGDTFDLARATRDSGRAALVFFGYAHCPDVCPTTLADWARVKRQLGGDSARVRFVFVTVDPERDSAAAVRRYVAQFDSAFVGLVPARPALDATLRAWRVAAYRDAGPDSAYTVAHPGQTFAVDPAGRLRLYYAQGARPADVAEDLGRLLD